MAQVHHCGMGDGGPPFLWSLPGQQLLEGMGLKPAPTRERPKLLAYTTITIHRDRNEHQQNASYPDQSLPGMGGHWTAQE